MGLVAQRICMFVIIIDAANDIPKNINITHIC